METWIVFPMFASMIVSTMSAVQERVHLISHFSGFDDKTCVSSLFSSPVRNRIHCVVLCTSNSQCESLFYTPDLKQCVGCPHFYVIYEEAGMLQNQPNTEHYGVGNFKSYVTTANPINNKPVYDQHDLYADGVRIAADKHVIVYVKVSSDAHVLLQKERTDYNGSVIEIVIGGWGNTKSVLRDKQQGPALVSYSESNILTNANFRPFWISFGSGCVKVGKGITVGSSTILDWCSLTFTVNYYSIGTYGVSGNWNIRTL